MIVVCKKKFLFQLGTKLLQAQRFNDPNDSCKIMVATDAIGMGLNLYVRTVLIFKIKSLDVFLNRSIKRVIFYSLVKPQLNEQGEKEKDTVTTSQALQIAGRAGRYNIEENIIKILSLYSVLCLDLQVLFQMVK